MKAGLLRALLILALLSAAGCSRSGPSPTGAPASRATVSSTPKQKDATPTPSQSEPFALISQESLFSYLQDLTAIQAHSGWRDSATQGEAEALDYVARRLGEFEYLLGLGMEQERQSFHVYLCTELRETGLELAVDGRRVQVPADGLRGHRDDPSLAIRFDSDGQLNDSDPNPVTVSGPVVRIHSAAELGSQPNLQGKVVFLDYAVIDRAVLGTPQATKNASVLLAKNPAGLVLVTRFSNHPGESHGAFAGDVGTLSRMSTGRAAPTLCVRLEDLAPAGIQSWDDLARIQEAQLTWDADVFSPGTSGNLAVRIPGADPSRTVILGAHIDSPNSPGAMDDGSGSAVLLEVARVLDAAQTQPPTDLYLVWFGSEELGLYGGSYFAATHQELLDRTLAMLQIDCLSRPVDGIDPALAAVAWSYGALGDRRLPWPDYLAKAAGRRDINLYAVDYAGIDSDNSAFNGFGVPNASLIYARRPAEGEFDVQHADLHIHDPYDTIELARQVGGVLEQMAHVALTAALETGRGGPELHISPRPKQRVLFVASHTEPVHMAPTMFIDMGMAFTQAGFDVDMIPYGQPVTLADLKGTDLVIALPVLDYPTSDSGAYDEAWTEEEIAALAGYAAGGGLLVLTNSAHRLKYLNMTMEANEDWGDANALATPFGITYQSGELPGGVAGVEGKSALAAGLSELDLAMDNGVPFTVAKGEVLAWVGEEPAMALVDYGEKAGQVLALADVGILGAGPGSTGNLDFWRSLAEYARSRPGSGAR